MFAKKEKPSATGGSFHFITSTGKWLSISDLFEEIEDLKKQVKELKENQSLHWNGYDWEDKWSKPHLSDIRYIKYQGIGRNGLETSKPVSLQKVILDIFNHLGLKYNVTPSSEERITLERKDNE